MNANASLSSIRVVSPTGGQVTGVGKYRYIGMLAEGGMADVYLAVTQSAGFEKLVVIKQLRPDLAQDPTFVTMFMDEARLAARLNHPNVVQTLEVGTDEKTGLHFIAMEFLEGVAYVRFARKKDRLPPPLSFHLRIIVETLRGLHYAHELNDFDGKPLNVVHRDVSPQNVMLTWAGTVKVLDFGIAKAALAAEARPEDFKGKLEYMAPEQAMRHEVDRRADVFSVGVMLHEALTRRRLFRKGEDKLAMLVEGRLPGVLDVAPTVPKQLADICARAMAHHPDHRYATADEMADDIESWLSSTQNATAREVGAYVAEMFASTRAKITAAVEEQLALFRRLESMPLHGTMPLQRISFADFAGRDILDTLPPGSQFPQYGMGSQPGVGSPQTPFISGETVRGMGASSPGFGTSPSRQAFAAPGTSPSRQTFSQPPPIPSMTPAQSMTPPMQPAPAKSSNGALIVVSTLLVLVVAAGGAGGFWMYRKAKSVAPTPAVAVTVAPAASSAPPVPDQVEYSIRAAPPEAKITVDGAGVANPATGKHATDSDKHTIHVEAAGYEPRDETVTFDRNVLVTIDLHPVASAAPVDAGALPKKGGTRRGH